MDDVLLTPKETTVILRCSLPMLYQLTERQDFPVVRLGRRKLIPKAGLMEWIEKQSGASKGGR